MKGIQPIMDRHSRLSVMGHVSWLSGESSSNLMHLSRYLTNSSLKKEDRDAILALIKLVNDFSNVGTKYEAPLSGASQLIFLVSESTDK